MKKPILSPAARSDLCDIWQYIAEDSPDNADTFLQKIEKTCLTLLEQPHAGRERKELIQNLRSFPIGHYLIFYRIIQENIEIVRILHAARDMENLF